MKSSSCSGEERPRKPSGLKQIKRKVSKSFKFPEKLMYVLDKGEHKEALWWGQDGDSFWIVPKSLHETGVLQYFGGTKFESLRRKLHRWGFRRVRNECFPSADIMVYSHPLFQRSKPELVKQMSIMNVMEDSDVSADEDDGTGKVSNSQQEGHAEEHEPSGARVDLGGKRVVLGVHQTETSKRMKMELNAQAQSSSSQLANSLQPDLQAIEGNMPTATMDQAMLRLLLQQGITPSHRMESNLTGPWVSQTRQFDADRRATLIRDLLLLQRFGQDSGAGDSHRHFHGIMRPPSVGNTTESGVSLHQMQSASQIDSLQAESVARIPQEQMLEGSFSMPVVSPLQNAARVGAETNRSSNATMQLPLLTRQHNQGISNLSNLFQGIRSESQNQGISDPVLSLASHYLAESQRSHTGSNPEISSHRAHQAMPSFMSSLPTSGNPLSSADVLAEAVTAHNRIESSRQDSQQLQQLQFLFGLLRRQQEE